MNLLHVGFLCACLFLLGRAPGLAASITLSSPAFDQGKPIPAKHALANANLSPELELHDVPPDAESLVLVVDDPDAPSGNWTHWLAWNIPPGTTSIPEGKLPPEAIQGKNSFGHVRYDGPAPPSGTHRYYFRLYALNTTVSLPTGASLSALAKAMDGHIIGSAELFGTYQAVH
jgi:Raf kinase inhibitor-like YbhB/YbcL family protein